MSVESNLAPINSQDKAGSDQLPVFLSEGDITFIHIGAMERHLGRPLDPDEIAAIGVLGEASVFHRTVEKQLQEYRDKGVPLSERTMEILEQIRGETIP